MEVIPIQFWKNSDSNLVSSVFVGKMTEVIIEQFLNALTPILITELGIVMEVRLVQPLNALSYIHATGYVTPLASVIVSGIVIAPDALALTTTFASVIFVV